MPNINRWLNQIEDGRKTRLDPVAAKQVTDALQSLLDQNNGKMNVKDFAAQAIGDNSNIGFIDKELLQKFDHHKTITLESFKDYLQNHPRLNSTDKVKYSNLADQMSKLQPEVEGTALLTKNQIKDIFREGIINQPDFLENIFGVATQGDYKNKYKFVDYKELSNLKEDVYEYVTKIINNASKKGVDVTSDILKNACRENFIKNSFNWGLGFATSAIFLSTLIPKMQYWITKMTTGQDKFPGTADYSNEKKKTKHKSD